MEGLKENKKLLTALLVVVIGSAGFLVYYFFLKPSPTSGLAEGGLIVEQGALDEFGGITGTDSVSAGATGDLIMMLSQLQNISLENKFDGRAGFSDLLDHSVHIESREPGRENPFAPFEGAVIFSEEVFVEEGGESAE